MQLGDLLFVRARGRGELVLIDLRTLLKFGMRGGLGLLEFLTIRGDLPFVIRARIGKLFLQILVMQLQLVLRGNQGLLNTGEFLTKSCDLGFTFLKQRFELHGLSGVKTFGLA